MAEIYKLPQGRIVVGFSDVNLSIGLLELHTGKELPKHNRPVKEELTQIVGSSTIKIFNNHNIHEIALMEGDTLEIQPNKFHIHSNPHSETSITLWRFCGDITHVIDHIRNSYVRV